MGLAGFHVFTEKNVSEKAEKLPGDLPEILGPIAETVDEIIHHEAFPDIPGDFVFTPDVNVEAEWGGIIPNDIDISVEGIDVEYIYEKLKIEYSDETIKFGFACEF